MKMDLMVLPIRNPGQALRQNPCRWLAARVCQAFFRGVCLLAVLLPASARADAAAFWQALQQPGHVALIRHALAPGTGDPSTFDLDDCRTQRNLSDEGRRQAQRIGATFRANGVAKAKLYSSQWCRCRETAELLGLGPVQELALLNSFYAQVGNRDQQTRDLNAWLAGQADNTPLVLVTHQVNITALTGVYPASGEIVLVRRSGDGGISVVGTLKTE